MTMTTISFFERFEADILSGKNTITIRNHKECNFEVGSTVDVVTFEANRWFAQLNITGVSPIMFNELSDEHAEQENMTLSELKTVISEIYPNETELYVISFELV